MTIDDELSGRLRAAVRQLPVPKRELQESASKRGRVALLVAVPLVVSVAVVAGIVLGRALDAYRAQQVASSVRQLSAVPALLSREDAIARVRGLNQMVGRVDRTEAKLMTWDEYVSVAGPVRAYPGDPQATPDAQGGVSLVGDPTQRAVWAVAVAGEVWPDLRVPITWAASPLASPTPFPPYRWGIFLVDASNGLVIGVAAAGAEQGWPVVFDGLSDHPIAPATAGRSVRLAPLPSRLQAADTVTITLHVLRGGQVDRMQAKLMTWLEFVQVAGMSVSAPEGAGPTTPVWLVAVAGTFEPSVVSGESPRWVIIAIDPATERTSIAASGSDAGWPVMFADLAEHPVAVP